VRSDNTASLIILAVLGVLMLVGVIWFLGSGGAGLWQTASEQGRGILALGVLLTVVLLVGLVVLVWSSPGVAAKTIAGTLGGIAIGVTMFLCLVTSAVIALLSACSRGCQQPPPRSH
jgi:hypothetical protein